MGKAAIIDPYLDSMGGGELYTLSFAKILLEMGYEVDLEWDKPGIKDVLSERFDLNLTGLNIVADTNRGDGYDLSFWVSDGSIPALKARKNILHFQVPFKDVNGKSLINRMKLFRVNKIISNSMFTKKTVDAEYGIDSIVIYPPVSIDLIKAKRKENLILYVGRFSNLLQSKRQDVLVDAFTKINLKDWRLVLAGGSEIGDDGFIEKLKKSSLDKNIVILESPSRKEILDYFGHAKIFWSASGFGINEAENPKKMEHFGISAVEAMAAGAVPVIYNGGGHKEIVTHDVDGYLWNNVEELITSTSQLVNNKIVWNNLSKNAKNSAAKFSYAKFRENVNKIL